MVLVDSHCHLFDIKGYQVPADVYPVIVGYSDSSNHKALAYAREGGANYPLVLGIAPQTALKEGLAKLDPWIDFIRKSRPNAIGEIGLDYKWAQKREDVERERILFGRMIALADEMDLPMVIHSRDKPGNPTKGTRAPDKEVPVDAVDECISMMAGKRFVMHFFSGTPGQAMRAVELGGYISISHMRSKDRRKVIETVPLERMLVESDAPFVGRTPESIREAVDYIAEAKKIEPALAAKMTGENAARFFGFDLPR